MTEPSFLRQRQRTATMVGPTSMARSAISISSGTTRSPQLRSSASGHVYLWVIVGDLPPAHLVTEECTTAKDAVEGYIEEMREWVAAAKAGLTSAEPIPVNVSAMPEWRKN